MWLTTFSACNLVHKVLERLGFRKDRSNILTCITFQIYVVYKCSIVMLYNVTGDAELCIQSMLGYFIYDLVYLTTCEKYKDRNIFILHHLISCLAIHCVSGIEDKSITYQSMFIFLAEFPSIFINTRTLLRSYPTLKYYNKRCMVYSYFVCRVVLFPVAAIGYISSIHEQDIVYILYIIFSAIYVASLNWFRVIIK